MKMQPVTKGRKQAVKRVERVLEVECQRARKALQKTAYEYGERDPRTITAHARYVETCGLQQAFSQGLQEYLQSLGRNGRKSDGKTGDHPEAQ